MIIYVVEEWSLVEMKEQFSYELVDYYLCKTKDIAMEVNNGDVCTSEVEFDNQCGHDKPTVFRLVETPLIEE